LAALPALLSALTGFRILLAGLLVLAALAALLSALVLLVHWHFPSNRAVRSKGKRAAACAVPRICSAWNSPAANQLISRLSILRKEIAMDWDRVEGNWKQMKGKVKEQWGKLTDDDLNVIDGKQDQLEGKIQERYGYAKDQVRREIDDWYNAQRW
jgi:uncharacterized protein YjbJ (UPF0337 family)